MYFRAIPGFLIRIRGLGRVIVESDVISGKHLNPLGSRAAFHARCAACRPIGLMSRYALSLLLLCKNPKFILCFSEASLKQTWSVSHTRVRRSFTPSPFRRAYTCENAFFTGQISFLRSRWLRNPLSTPRFPYMPRRSSQSPPLDLDEYAERTRSELVRLQKKRERKKRTALEQAKEVVSSRVLITLKE